MGKHIFDDCILNEMRFITNLSNSFNLESKYICFKLCLRYDNLRLYRISGRYIKEMDISPLSGDMKNLQYNALTIYSLNEDNTVLVRFQSDYSVSGRGFHIWYQSSKNLFS